MDNKEDILVRQATVNDLPILAGIEQLVWNNLKTEVLNIEHFKAWLEVYEEGFWVAEVQGKVVGYLAWQKVFFDFGSLRQIDFGLATDKGFIRKTHQSNGNCFYGISSCSIHAGAGGALAKHGEQMTIKHCMQCAIAFCRMPGFTAYLEEVYLLNKKTQLGHDPEEQLALHYTLETARLVGGKIGSPSAPELDLRLPLLRKRDPVIGRFLRYTEFRLWGVAANYMQDPLSRDFAAILIFDNPVRSSNN